MMTLEFEIQLLRKRHDRNAFECGEPSLDLYLKQYARQSAEKGLGRTFVATIPGKSEVLGYYTLASGNMSFEIVPERLPRYPIPVVHLGRLAVDLNMQGQRLGGILLVDALNRVASVADDLGIYAVELYAMTEKAKSFYLKFGFLELKDDDKHLYLPMETVRRAFLKSD